MLLTIKAERKLFETPSNFSNLTVAVLREGVRRRETVLLRAIETIRASLIPKLMLSSFAATVLSLNQTDDSAAEPTRIVNDTLLEPKLELAMCSLLPPVDGTLAVLFGENKIGKPKYINAALIDPVCITTDAKTETVEM
jgi:hypothetical protein